MENLPTLKFEAKTDVYEKLRQLHGYGEDEGRRWIFLTLVDVSTEVSNSSL